MLLIKLCSGVIAGADLYGLMSNDLSCVEACCYDEAGFMERCVAIFRNAVALHSQELIEHDQRIRQINQRNTTAY